jgi:hypothetical protein
MLLIPLIGSLTFTGCEKSRFWVKEEIAGEARHSFTLEEAYYLTDRTIELTRGKYQIVGGDSLVLYISGAAKFSVTGKDKLAGFDIKEKARFYLMLPPQLAPRSYTINNRAICEIIGNAMYDPGESLFICESGQVTIDSLVDTKIYGAFAGQYVNTSNNRLEVDGPFAADRK